MNERHRWRALLALLAACLLAGACGSDDSDDSGSGADVTSSDDTTGDTTADTQSEDDVSTAEEDASADDIAADQASGEIDLVEAINDLRGEGTPKPGGVLVYDWPSDIGTLDTITSSSFQTHARVGLVNETLFSFQTGPDIGATQQVIIPRLAESLDISDDGLTYTIKLREDHDGIILAAKREQIRAYKALRQLGIMSLCTCHGRGCNVETVGIDAQRYHIRHIMSHAAARHEHAA